MLLLQLFDSTSTTPCDTLIASNRSAAKDYMAYLDRLEKNLAYRKLDFNKTFTDTITPENKE